MEMKFTEALMEEIVTKGRKTPKVQVERYISPILSIFLEELLCINFENNYELIASEFPIRKGRVNKYNNKLSSNEQNENSNQSTNIDYLLFNRTEKKFTFVELKTDATSYKQEQLNIYQYLQNVCEDTQNKTSEKFGKILYEDLVKIRDASSYQDKYNYILDEWNDQYSEITQMEIIYLVPKATNLKVKEKIKEQVNDPYIQQDNILYFENFPLKMKHTFPSVWDIIIKYLHILDSKYEHATLTTNTVYENSFQNLKLVDLVEFKAKNIEPTIIELQKFFDKDIRKKKKPFELTFKDISIPMATSPEILNNSFLEPIKDKLHISIDNISRNYDINDIHVKNVKKIRVMYNEDYSYGEFNEYNLDSDAISSVTEYENIEECLLAQADCSYIENYSYSVYLEISLK